MPVPVDTTFRTTITYPRAWESAVKAAVKHLRENEDPGARPNDIYREALRQYLISKGYLKDGE
jgi:hypothetical protein